MMVMTGLYKTDAEAAAAVKALEDAGIASADISLISPDRGQAEATPPRQTARGAEVGSAIGGVGGVLAGLGAFAIPGIGPVVGAGWLAATLVGALAGGVAGGAIGAMTKAGMADEDAHLHAESVRRGNSMVIARVDEAQADGAAAILGQGAIGVENQRAEYHASGWNAFNEAGDPWKYRREDEPGASLPPPLPR